MAPLSLLVSHRDHGQLRPSPVAARSHRRAARGPDITRDHLRALARACVPASDGWRAAPGADFCDPRAARALPVAVPAQAVRACAEPAEQIQ